MTSIRCARKEGSFKQNRFITKLIANDLPMLELSPTSTLHQNLCPCCKRVQETNVHLFTYASTADFRETLLTELDTLMVSLQTESQLQNFLLSGIRSWVDDPEHGTIPFNIPMDFLTLATKQNNIGWYSALLCFLHQDIIRYQHSHYLQPHSRRTGTAWAKHIISKFWK